MSKHEIETPGIDCACRPDMGDGMILCPLHASAPELLDALRGLLNRVENMTSEEYSRGGDKAAREAAGAAIRKAEGSGRREP